MGRGVGAVAIILLLVFAGLRLEPATAAIGGGTISLGYPQSYLFNGGVRSYIINLTYGNAVIYVPSYVRLHGIDIWFVDTGPYTCSPGPVYVFKINPNWVLHDWRLIGFLGDFYINASAYCIGPGPHKAPTLNITLVGENSSVLRLDYFVKTGLFLTALIGPLFLAIPAAVFLTVLFWLSGDTMFILVAYPVIAAVRMYIHDRI